MLMSRLGFCPLCHQKVVLDDTLATLRRIARVAFHERNAAGRYLGTSLCVSMVVGLVLPFGPGSLLTIPPYWLMLGLASATATVWDNLNAVPMS